MTPATTMSEQVPVLRQVARWWVGRRDRTAVAELTRWGQDETCFRDS
jgi:hypothetical protein